MFCSIVLRAGLPSYSGGNHLSPDASSPSGSLSVRFLRESSPTIIWVSRSWGLPRSTLNVSIKTSSLWHFQSIRALSVKNLGCFPAVSPNGLPQLIVSSGTNTTIVSDRASMDFPLHVASMRYTAITRTLSLLGQQKQLYLIIDHLASYPIHLF